MSRAKMRVGAERAVAGAPGDLPAPAGRPWLLLILLWLAGNSIRMTLLAVPPVLPTIHRGLHLDEAIVGALTSFPVLLLALAAVPGSLLVARLGARRSLILGLVVIAIAGAARGIGPSIPMLFGMTVIMGIGASVSQPALPTLVRLWFPRQAGRATAVYSNGLLIGEVVAAALTVPLILPLVGGSWERALAVWSVPVALTAAAVLLLSPATRRDPDAAPSSWWPDWRNGRTWRLGFILGGASAAYWGSNAFIPDYLKATHHAALISPALTAVNLLQLPASLVIAAFPGRMVGRRWPFIVAGALTILAIVSVPAVSGPGVVALMGMLGFATALVFVLSLALPPLLAGPGDVHRLSAAMFTISYACPFAGSLLGGAIWDVTGIPLTAFVPVVAGGVLMIAMAVQLDLAGHGRS